MVSDSFGKAAVFEGIGKPFVVRSFPIPQVEDEGILVKISLATICGSDLHRVKGYGKTAIPSILGHESTGRIEKLGPKIDVDYQLLKVKEGDRIVYPYFKYCGRCYSCLNRQITLSECEDRFALSGGISCDSPPYFNGAFAEYLYLRPKMYFFKVPDSIPDEVLVPVNCAASAVYYGLWKLGKMPYGYTVVIQGAGALGLYASVFCKEFGASKVIVVDTVPERLYAAEQFGADYIVEIEKKEGKTSDIQDEIRKITYGNGADLAIDVSGSPLALVEGLKMLRKGGKYLEMGTITQASTGLIDISTIALKELIIRGSMNYDYWVIPKVLSFLETTQDRYPYKDIVTHVFQLERINEAFQVASRKECIRVAISPATK